MTRVRRFLVASRIAVGFSILALAFTAGAGTVSRAEAQPGFPHIALWAFPGGFRDSSLYRPNRCIGLFQAGLADSIAERARTVTVRWKRDRRAEARADFGGYRIYRSIGSPDTSEMMLIRRFSRNSGDERTWNFSVVDTNTLEFRCQGRVAGDSVVTFVDPDSNGNYVKVCKRLDNSGRCLSRGDSIFVLLPPPGPHDGFRIWYSITYEARNTNDNNYLDLFVPGPYDTSGDYSKCGTYGDSTTCPRVNLNNKAANRMAFPVEVTAGPTPNLEHVGVVPNPYRAQEAWDQPGAHEIHFINLPVKATIKIYTVSGDLVTTLTHDDPVHDFERWNLKNQAGRDVASGIYMYRIESASLSFQNRFIVVR